MDVRIGVTQVPREIEVELADDIDPEELAAQVEKALATETGMLWLTDRKGKKVGVPAGRLAYVEISITSDERRVGFGAHAR